MDVNWPVQPRCTPPDFHRPRFALHDFAQPRSAVTYPTGDLTSYATPEHFPDTAPRIVRSRWSIDCSESELERAMQCQIMVRDYRKDSLDSDPRSREARPRGETLSRRDSRGERRTRGSSRLGWSQDRTDSPRRLTRSKSVCGDSFRRLPSPTRRRSRPGRRSSYEHSNTPPRSSVRNSSRRVRSPSRASSRRNSTPPRQLRSKSVGRVVCRRAGTPPRSRRSKSVAPTSFHRSPRSRNSSKRYDRRVREVRRSVSPSASSGSSRRRTGRSSKSRRRSREEERSFRESSDMSNYNESRYNYTCGNLDERLSREIRSQKEEHTSRRFKGRFCKASQKDRGVLLTQSEHERAVAPAQSKDAASDITQLHASEYAGNVGTGRRSDKYSRSQRPRVGHRELDCLDSPFGLTHSKSLDTPLLSTPLRRSSGLSARADTVKGGRSLQRSRNTHSPKERSQGLNLVSDTPVSHNTRGVESSLTTPSQHQSASRVEAEEIGGIATLAQSREDAMHFDASDPVQRTPRKEKSGEDSSRSENPPRSPRLSPRVSRTEAEWWDSPARLTRSRSFGRICFKRLRSPSESRRERARSQDRHFVRATVVSENTCKGDGVESSTSTSEPQSASRVEAEETAGGTTQVQSRKDAIHFDASDPVQRTQREEKSGEDSSCSEDSPRSQRRSPRVSRAEAEWWDSPAGLTRSRSLGRICSKRLQSPSDSGRELARSPNLNLVRAALVSENACNPEGVEYSTTMQSENQSAFPFEAEEIASCATQVQSRENAMHFEASDPVQRTPRKEKSGEDCSCSEDSPRSPRRSPRKSRAEAEWWDSPARLTRSRSSSRIFFERFPSPPSYHRYLGMRSPRSGTQSRSPQKLTSSQTRSPKESPIEVILGDLRKQRRKKNVDASSETEGMETETCLHRRRKSCPNLRIGDNINTTKEINSPREYQRSSKYRKKRRHQSESDLLKLGVTKPTKLEMTSSFSDILSFLQSYFRDMGSRLKAYCKPKKRKTSEPLRISLSKKKRLQSEAGTFAKKPSCESESVPVRTERDSPTPPIAEDDIRLVWTDDSSNSQEENAEEPSVGVDSPQLCREPETANPQPDTQTETFGYQTCTAPLQHQDSWECNSDTTLTSDCSTIVKIEIDAFDDYDSPCLTKYHASYVDSSVSTNERRDSGESGIGSSHSGGSFEGMSGPGAPRPAGPAGEVSKSPVPRFCRRVAAEACVLRMEWDAFPSEDSDANGSEDLGNARAKSVKRKRKNKLGWRHTKTCNFDYFGPYDPSQRERKLQIRLDPSVWHRYLPNNQRIVMAALLVANRDLARHYTLDGEGNKETWDDLWLQWTEQLNACEPGFKMTPHQWKFSWMKWREDIRKMLAKGPDTWQHTLGQLEWVLIEPADQAEELFLKLQATPTECLGPGCPRMFCIGASGVDIEEFRGRV